MTIFTRGSESTEPGIASPAKSGATVRDPQAANPGVAGGGAASGVLPPASSTYSTRPENTASTPGAEVESLVAEKVRIAREAQHGAQERVRVSVRHDKTVRPAPGVQRRATRPELVATAPRPTTGDPESHAQFGLLRLAWMWQEAGAPLRAIHAYTQLLERYPGTLAAADAVSDMVTLSEKLAAEGQFHTALLIYEHLDRLL